MGDEYLFGLMTGFTLLPSVILFCLIKPQYAEVYLNNAIRFLKDNK